MIIVFGIIMIYAYNMMIIPQKTVVQTFAVNLINMGIFILILITVSSRFILSSFCKEADTISLLMKCPLSKRDLVREKLKFAFMFNIPLSIFLSILTITLLKLPLFFQIYNMIIGICTGLVISFITIYYSIIIFDYTKSRPEALIMTPTGVTFMAISFMISMVYVVLYFVLLNVYFVKMFTNGQYGIFLSYVFLITFVIVMLTYLVCKVYYDRGIVGLGVLYSDYER